MIGIGGLGTLKKIVDKGRWWEFFWTARPNLAVETGWATIVGEADKGVWDELFLFFYK